MDMSIVVANGKYSFLSHAKEVFGSVDLCIELFYLLLFGGKPRNLVCIDQLPTSKAKVHSQFNHGSRKTGQAAGAGGLKQDRYVHICDIRPRICDLRLSLSDL